MRRLIPPDCESQEKDRQFQLNASNQPSLSSPWEARDDPMSPELRLQFQTLQEMTRCGASQQQQQQQAQDEEFLEESSTATFDDDEDDGMFSFERMDHNHEAIQSHFLETQLHQTTPSIATETSPILQLALSTSIAAQKEIDDLMNGIAELEDFLQHEVPRSTTTITTSPTNIVDHSFDDSLSSKTHTNATTRQEQDSNSMSDDDLGISSSNDHHFVFSGTSSARGGG